MTKYLDRSDILRLHRIIERRATQQGLGGGPYGVRDQGAFESAVFRPKQTLFDQDAFPTLFLKAAALARSLARNHAFHNGNKRTALLATVAFLRLNGYEFGLSQQEADEIAAAFQAVSDGLPETVREPTVQRQVLHYYYLVSLKDCVARLGCQNSRESNDQGDLALAWPVEWDWELFNFKRGQIMVAGDTPNSAMQRSIRWLADTLTTKTLAASTWWSAFTIDRNGSSSYGFGDDAAHYMADLPADEKRWVKNAIFQPVCIGQGSPNFREVFENLLHKMGLQNASSHKLSRYRDHLQFIEDYREVPEGLSIQVDSLPANHSLLIHPEVQLLPLTIDGVQATAYFPTTVNFSCGEDEHLAMADSDMRSLILEEMGSDIENHLVEAERGIALLIHSLLSEARANHGDKFSPNPGSAELGNQDLRSLPKNYEVPPLDSSVPQNRPMIGEVWKFIVKLVEEHLEVEEIAAWLETWTVKVE